MTNISSPDEPGVPDVVTGRLGGGCVPMQNDVSVDYCQRNEPALAACAWNRDLRQ